MGMFGYMTDTETVEPIDTVEVESEGELPVSVGPWQQKHSIIKGMGDPNEPLLHVMSNITAHL